MASDFSKYVDHSSGKARQYRYMERMKQDKERLTKRRDYEREKKLDKKFEVCYVKRTEYVTNCKQKPVNG